MSGREHYYGRTVAEWEQAYRAERSARYHMAEEIDELKREVERLSRQLAGAVDALRELDGMALAARNAGQTLDPETVAAICDAALAPLVGGQ